MSIFLYLIYKHEKSGFEFNFKYIFYTKNDLTFRTFNSWKEFIDYQLSKSNFHKNYLFNRFLISKNNHYESTIKLEESIYTDNNSTRSNSTISLEIS